MSFGVLAVMTLAGSLSKERFLILIPLAMGVFGYVLCKVLVFPLADEAYIDGDDIVIRNRGDEDRFPISNIINVDASMMINPERITLTLREPCKFGDEIVFSPPARIGMFLRHPLAKELIRMADQQRLSRR